MTKEEITALARKHGTSYTNRHAAAIAAEAAVHNTQPFESISVYGSRAGDAIRSLVLPAKIL